MELLWARDRWSNGLPVLLRVSTVVPPPGVIDEGIVEWDRSVVGQFIGDAPNFGSMQRISEILWGKSLKVKLYNVPLELFSRLGLSYIASAVGISLYMDSVTASKERLEFAKVCVEVEAGAVIPEVIHGALRDNSLVKVWFYVPWLPKFCVQCKTFGHLASNCVEVQKRLPKSKEAQVWRKKVSLNNHGSSDKEGLIGSSCSIMQETNPSGKVLGVTFGTAEVTSVHALQEINVGPLQEAKEAATDQVQGSGKYMEGTKILPVCPSQDIAKDTLQGGLVDVQVPVLGDFDATAGSSKQNISSDQLGDAGLNLPKGIGANLSCGGDFPSLQDFLISKKKARGKKKR
ncbi:uncharacterized protein LOC120211067 [Hibiscus syriacus]|uniref:uncharacterized protein LOC120211067 n=1 Tax=Hibiscus syriacus TaxID=106335 RepID=UPI001921C474|nr:uncharacterized protein LOC120211067 [Hibiscus syriacus]